MTATAPAIALDVRFGLQTVPSFDDSDSDAWITALKAPGPAREAGVGPTP